MPETVENKELGTHWESFIQYIEDTIRTTIPDNVRLSNLHLYNLISDKNIKRGVELESALPDYSVITTCYPGSTDIIMKQHTRDIKKGRVNIIPVFTESNDTNKPCELVKIFLCRRKSRLFQAREYIKDFISNIHNSPDELPQ